MNYYKRYRWRKGTHREGGRKEEGRGQGRDGAKVDDTGRDHYYFIK